MTLWPFSKRIRESRSLEEVRPLTRTLFIDDDEDFDIVEILRRAGWNVKLVADIDALDEGAITSSHVVFVDIQGVGQKMRFDDEGLGLAAAIKELYPEKQVVLYSSAREGDRFHKALSLVDERIPKDAEPYQFLCTLEALACQCFSFDACVERVAAIILRESPGMTVDKEQVRRTMRSLAKRSKLTPGKVARVLSISLEKAGNVVSILGMFGA